MNCRVRLARAVGSPTWGLVEHCKLLLRGPATSDFFLYTDASAYGCRDRLIRTNLGHQAKNGTIGRPGEL